jgi:hypothetical protein
MLLAVTLTTGAVVYEFIWIWRRASDFLLPTFAIVIGVLGAAVAAACSGLRTQGLADPLVALWYE